MPDGYVSGMTALISLFPQDQHSSATEVNVSFDVTLVTRLVCNTCPPSGLDIYLPNRSEGRHSRLRGGAEAINCTAQRSSATAGASRGLSNVTAHSYEVKRMPPLKTVLPRRIVVPRQKPRMP